MNTNYSKLPDSELCNARLAAFLSDLPIGDRRSLNSEFKKRFPKMCLSYGVLIGVSPEAEEKPHWLMDETPSFFEPPPDWMQREGAPKKFKFKKSSPMPK